MSFLQTTRRGLVLLSMAVLSCVVPAFADTTRPPMLEGIGVDEKIGRNIDLSLTFVAENGYPVALRDYFKKDKPVILDLVYYRCPMLCNLVLNGQTNVLRDIPWTPGNEYEVVTISIDPTENFDLAKGKRGLQLASFGREAPGWHFLADKDGNVKRLAEQVGFHYRYDESIGQYAHQAAIMILTPEGKVSRYLYGVKFPTRNIRLALTEAAAGKGKFSIDRVLLFCYRYDPKSHSYGLFAANFMRLGGALTVLIFGIILWRLWRQDRIHQQRLVSAK